MAEPKRKSYDELINLNKTNVKRNSQLVYKWTVDSYNYVCAQDAPKLGQKFIDLITDINVPENY